MLRFDAISFILGLGYVMGLRSSTILCAGGVLSNLVLVPLIWYVGRDIPASPATRAGASIADMDAGEIFRSYVRFIGVGAIATAGIFGIIKSLRIVRAPSRSPPAPSGTARPRGRSAPTATCRSRPS